MGPNTGRVSRISKSPDWVSVHDVSAGWPNFFNTKTAVICVVRGVFFEKRQSFTAAVVTPQKLLLGVLQITLSTLPEDPTLASTITVPEMLDIRQTAGYSGMDIDTTKKSADGD
jgi:hypothetical protein